MGVVVQAPSQARQILDVLESGRELTPLEALREMGCLRLAARIHDLKAAGHPIETTTRTVAGKSFAVYSLPPTQRRLPL